jgi:glycosyltransferase involved in cell wall biosynthesis
VIVCDRSFELGRGPLHRLAGMLPALARQATLRVVTLGEPSPPLCAILDGAGVTHTAAPYSTDGWDVTSRAETVAVVAQVLEGRRPDLLMLSWEIWDLVTDLRRMASDRGVPFGVTVHSVPLVDAPPMPANDFQVEVDARLARESDRRIAAYIERHRDEVGPTLSSIGVIAANRTVAWFLDRYFPGLHAVTLERGYALDRSEVRAGIASRRLEFDAAFMAKLVPEKGIFDLLECASAIRKRMDKFRCLVLGDFEDASTRRRYLEEIDRRDLKDTLVLAGWCSGAAKYRALASARLFLYPACTSDTFSICLMEALAVGLPALCYEAPFVRQAYPCEAVRTVAMGDFQGMADDAMELMRSPQELVRLGADAAAFGQAFGDWEAVASSELEAYRRLLSVATTHA